MATTEIGTREMPSASKPSNIKAIELHSLLQRPVGWTICLSLLIGIAVLRIASTYHVFNATIDEASHIAGGIEWWDKGTYTLETKHTPLARVSVALGPYLAGVRWMGFKAWRTPTHSDDNRQLLAESDVGTNWRLAVFCYRQPGGLLLDEAALWSNYRSG